MLNNFDEPTHRSFPVRLDQDLYDAFYKVFPQYGARSIFIREAIRAALRQLSEEDNTLNISAAVKLALKSPALRIRLSNR